MSSAPKQHTRQAAARTTWLSLPRLLPVLAILLPLAVLLAALLHTVRYVPMFDDYPAILQFGLALRQQHNLLSRLGFTLFTQTGDYKLIFEHVLTALDLLITSRVHFGFLIWLGNLLGILVLWPLWCMHLPQEKDLQRRLWLFLPVSFLYLQMNAVENFNWAMCGLQTYPAVLFALLALLWAARSSSWPYTLLACGALLLSASASSNGFLVAPLGAILYLGRRAWKPLALWLAVCLGAVALYLHGYHSLHNVLHNENTTATNQVLFYLSFLGSAAENQHRQPVRFGAAVLGLLVLTLFVLSLLRRFHQRNPAVTAMGCWVLLTALPVTILRLPAGFQYSLVMRYKIYSDLFLICGYFCFLDLALSFRPRQRRTLVAAICVITFGMWIASDALGYRYLVKRQQRVALGLETFIADRTRSPQITVSGDPIDPIQNERVRQTLLEAIGTGIYKLPAPSRL